MFTTLNTVMSKGDIATIVVMKNADNQLTVSVNFKSQQTDDPARDMIQPFCVHATPEELNLQFAQTIKAPLEQSAGLQNSMSEFEKSMEIAKANSKAEEQKKAAAKKLDEEIKKAAALIKGKKYKEAQTALMKLCKNNASELSDSQKNTIKKYQLECEQALDNGLFGSFEEPKETTVTEEPIDLDMQVVDDDEINENLEEE